MLCISDFVKLEFKVMNNNPFVPLFTIERSGEPEVMVSGIISIVKGIDKSNWGEKLLSCGDVDFPVWSRSLLKPWQLLSHLPILKEKYQNLSMPHFALISASHSGEPEHLCVLQQLLEIGQLQEELLRCPESMPLATDARLKLALDGHGPRRLFHNCSGKHLGYLLALKAQNLPLATYLEPSGRQFALLKNILATLVEAPPSSLAETTDGCQLPNYALTPRQMAGLYGGLLSTRKPANVPNSLANFFSCYLDLAKIMRGYPNLIGGSKRLDTKLMLGKVANYQFERGLQMVAKEGAEGLLAIGIGACLQFPLGAGIVIKLASGGSERHMEMIVCELMKQLRLVDGATVSGEARPSHLQTKFHFQVVTR
jgi:L-asparaginase II